MEVTTKKLSLLLIKICCKKAQITLQHFFLSNQIYDPENEMYLPMVRRLLSLFIVALSFGAYAQDDVRAFDGSKNNLQNPTYGAVGQQLKRLGSAMYADGVETPMDRMNPREISNRLFAQEEIIGDPLGLSAYVWVFGQFIDHDITLVPNNDHEFMPIVLPPDDFLGTIIPFTRSSYDPETGSTAGVPREHINIITAFIDGSGIYGSDQVRADWLRTFEGGKMKMSSGDLLPFETKDGEFNSPRDNNAPFMADDTRSGQKMMIAGDLRANENLYLTASHILFVKEHNRLATEIASKNPSWSDEDIYQQARRMVIGYIQNITYQEWLPAMGISLPPYNGYDPNINPSISNEFSAAAFRMGHTLINSTVYRMDQNGGEMPQGNLLLRNAYFNPIELITGGGIDPLFKGMATQLQQDFDCKVVDEVRNFLFGSPGYGGLDLAAINIFRGRERGIPDYNTLRTSIGLSSVSSFTEITTKIEVAQVLEEIYETVDDVDAWVGMLAEDHMQGSLFGPTVNAIIRSQFLDLRDGDRFFFEVDPKLSEDDKQVIRSTKFSDIIRRNTSIDLMQENVFIATPHQDLPNSKVVVTERHLDMVAYPTPFETYINLKVYSLYEGITKITMMNAFGQEVSENYQNLIRGENTFEVDVNSKLAPGVYTIQLQMDERTAFRKILKN